MNRDNRVTLRLSDDELAALDDAVAADPQFASVSEYLRWCLDMGLHRWEVDG